jgi:photosystem II stability/assembly factor-like uncharacterized protein
MADRLVVATRKGLFTYGRDGTGAWSVERTAFLGDPVSLVMEDPRDGTLLAALKLGHFGVKLQRSEDGGASWKECQAPAFPKAQGEEAADAKAPSVKEVWALAPGGADEPGLIWCGTIPGGLFRSRDGGQSWELVQSLWDRPERQKWFGGGADEPGIHSICVDPRDARHVTLGVSCGGVWQTKDGGETWAQRAHGMRAEYLPPEKAGDPETQDPHQIVQCPGAPDVLWAQHHNGIFRSTDGSASWHEIADVQPSVFGFAVAVHPHDPETAWFVPAVKDECRIPVDGKLVVTRTRDGGKSFEILRAGLPQEHAYDLVYRHALDVAGSGARLAFGSTTGGLWLSEDGGDAWQTLSTHLPPVYAVRFLA